MASASVGSCPGASGSYSVKLCFAADEPSTPYSADLKRFREITSSTSSPGASWCLCARLWDLFKKMILDKRNAVIMGRRTWESIPPAFRPLPGRLNIVLSATAAASAVADTAEPAAAAASAVTVGSLEAALAVAVADPAVEDIFIIGGAAVYAAALLDARCSRVYMTRVAGRPSFTTSFAACDVFFPDLDPAQFVCVTPDAEVHRQEEDGITFQFLRYDRAA
jgi:dihydrofolate reductase